MPWSESLPQFSLAGTVLTVLLLLFAAFGEPLLGRKAFTWLSRRRDGDARALTLLHAVTMGIHVLWGLVVFGVLLLSPNLVAADLGLRLPDAWGPIAGGAVGGLLALTVFWLLVNGLPRGPGRSGRGGRPARGRRAQGASARGRRSSAPLSLPQPERDRGLLAPRTTAERAMAAGVAVTGGVFGELLYRGLFILLVASMGVPLWIAAALSVLLFSVAHLYQGWWGLVSAGASGTLFTVLYLGTGSVWVPVLVHVALNLRSLVFPPADVREAGERERREDEGDPEAYEEYDEYGEYDEYEHHGHGYEDGSSTGEQPLTDAEEGGSADTAVAPAPPGTGTPAHGTPSHGAVPGYGGTPGHGGPSVYGDLPDQGRNLGHGDPYGHGGNPGHGGHSAYGDLPARSGDFGPGAPHTDSGPHTHGGAFQQDLYSGLSTSGPASGHGDPLGDGGPPGHGDRFGGGDQGGHVGQPGYGYQPGYGGHRSDGTPRPAPPRPGPSHGGPPPNAPLYPGASRPDPLPPHGAPADPSHDGLLGGGRRDEGRGERRLYPDEWIDRRYGDANTTPGPEPDRWS
ncbi:CPBP family intramembrane glutamic endopeptidase [Nocardiopsis dassonvillei]|uniref:CPBP family intramembrane glutamic endopeptidase n=1 Tax=Nocardiopsis dassonvillei TaxID=2014 RepID=UPI003407EA72